MYNSLSNHHGKSPSEAEGVCNAGVQALSTIYRMNVRGISTEEYAPSTVF